MAFCGFRPHSQRRDRAGLAPASLLMAFWPPIVRILKRTFMGKIHLLFSLKFFHCQCEQTGQNWTESSMPCFVVHLNSLIHPVYEDDFLNAGSTYCFFSYLMESNFIRTYSKSAKLSRKVSMALVSGTKESFYLRVARGWFSHGLCLLATVLNFSYKTAL